MPSRALADREIPDLHFGLYDGLAALEHASGKLYLVATGAARAEAEVLGQLQQRVDAARCLERPQSAPAAIGAWQWNLSKAEFLQAVGAVKDYIARGDVYQVNLSQARTLHVPWEWLAALSGTASRKSAPYSAYIDAGDLTVLSTSPEQFLRKRGRHLETRPIKGTRPRGRRRNWIAAMHKPCASRPRIVRNS